MKERRFFLLFLFGVFGFHGSLSYFKLPCAVAAPAPVVQPEPPAIAKLIKPELLQRVLEEKEILSSAKLDSGHYSFYSTMLVHSSLSRTRRVLTDYALYSQLIPYVDKTDYSPITQVLDVQGGVWKWRLRSQVHFEERGDRWIHYAIVGGHFRGLVGDMFFEPAGDRGVLVYFRGDQDGQEWPPRFVIERGAEIVFGFTAARMRKYVESNADIQAPPVTPLAPTVKGPPNGSDLPQPRNHL